MGADAGSDATAMATCVEPREVSGLLGRAFQLVVYDARESLDPNTLGQCHGFIWGGGALIVLLPEPPTLPDEDAHRLAAFPFSPEDVGSRFTSRLIARLERAASALPSEPLSPQRWEVRGSEDQRRVVEALVSFMAGGEDAFLTLIADRGRGKSSALGLAVAQVLEQNREARVAVCAGSEDAVQELFRFATGQPDVLHEGAVRFVPITELVISDERFDVILIDEAAQMPVPFLQRVVQHHTNSRFAFATTTHGYEGTGRGFALRFVAWLEELPGSLRQLELTQPIRWSVDDALERIIFDALLLDAAPARIQPEEVSLAALTVHQIDRDRLVADERLLRQVFGLLVHAHYRTTPADLRRILDAPNLELHAVEDRSGHVLAVTLVALEGGLSQQLCEELYSGKRRLRGHALPETLVSHLSHKEAGMLRMCRSVRIATHPDSRRLGLASLLVEHVHRHYSPDLFGTVFGATPELLAFRRSLGYELVRVSASRGSRTGEPSATMIYPVSDAARALVARSREELARELPLQLELLVASDELLLDPELERACLDGMETSKPMAEARLQEIVHAYAYGPRTHIASALALKVYVSRHEHVLSSLSSREQQLIRGRILEQRGWGELVVETKLPGFPATMRALRRAVRAFLERVSSAPPTK
ncbi:MAG: GNAT family N-acetyltransferase [Myxococcota bacterium]|nr:GNAT family N-acetyltransferase [Myxococcota bacterium]